MIHRALLCALVLVAAASCATRPPQPLELRRPPTVDLSPCSPPVSGIDASCATYPVFEDRAGKSGRIIPLKILVLPASTASPAPDPIFVLAGGRARARRAE